MKRVIVILFLFVLGLGHIILGLVRALAPTQATLNLVAKGVWATPWHPAIFLLFLGGMYVWFAVVFYITAKNKRHGER